MHKEKPVKIPPGMPEGRFLKAALILLIVPLIMIASVYAQNAPDVDTMPLEQLASAIAQAEREKEAGVILGSAELAIAQKFVDAADIYSKNRMALQLRAMNIIYETTKERGATVLLPTAMADSMNPGGILGLAQASSKPV
jgi:hypothetical protein